MVDAIDSKSIFDDQSAGSSPVVGKCRLACFDLDGLLVDTEKLHYLAYKKALLAENIFLEMSFSSYYKRIHFPFALKKHFYQSFPLLQKKWDTIQAKKRFFYQTSLKSHVSLQPSAKKLLFFFKKKHIDICVVTNSGQSDVTLIKHKIPILQEIVSKWVTRELYKRAKPHPDGYLEALKHFAHPPSIGLEDTLKGIEALQLANIHPYLICKKAHLPPTQLPKVAHFENLLPFLEQVKTAKIAL